ncbi:DUF397 domain-containing protein [Streptomyces olivoreticuli]|uniref:DUF397 domain-containing protein n=1 Tax=Streptomyces olivoreticuli TaxID=68246 RepID=UPI000E2454C6|nr:DUF397 domain-containing protein [Streptomyces olivoreticuli]
MSTSRPDLTAAVWRKSSYTGLNDNDCVEVADRQFPGTVPIRDSKNPDGPAITPTTTAWSAFVTAVANGDLPA